MHKSWITLALVLSAALPLSCATSRSTGKITPEQEAVMVPVHQFVDGFNTGDIQSAVAACTDPVCIIDDFPPHEWEGVGAMSRWLADYTTDARQRGITDGVVSLARPLHIDVTGDHAYVVVPADYVYKQQGVKAMQAGSILTVALHKGKSGWLITGWSWSKH
jgi:ketosteroid isomerase-like protein